MNRLASTLLASLLAACSAVPPRDAPPPRGIAGFVAQPDGIYTGGRIGDAELATLREAGVRGIIDLTPDAETPDFDEAAATRALGFAYANLPLAGPDDLSLEHVQAFDAMLASAPRPLLVHCASSNRVGAMAALRAAWIGGHSTGEALGIGRAWGLRSLEPAVRARLEAGPR